MTLEQFTAGTFTRQYQYKSFTPTLLNTEWTWSDPKLNTLLAEANLKLGELNAFSTHIPDIDIFIRMHIVKEATTSSRIEGTRTEMEDVVMKKADIDAEKRDDWQEVQNYIRAMNHAIKRLSDVPVSTRLLKETHKTLMSGVRGKAKLPGEYRKSQNWIGGATLQDAVFIPPHHTEVPAFMGDLENFLHKVAGYGYRTIADKLNTEKVPCPKRGRWRNKNQMWSTVTVQTIVTNPSYRGDRIYNRHPLSKKLNGEANVLGKTKERWVNDEREWIVQRDAHSAIISRELFDKANPPSVRHERGKRNIHYYESPYLLTGLVRCERCGFNFQGQSYRKSSHFYYVDGGNMNKGKSVCERTAIRRELLEDFVTNIIMDSLPFSKSATRLEEMIREYLNGHDRKDHLEASTDKRLHEIDRKMQNLLDAVEQGIGLDTVLARIKELENEKNALEQERSRIPVKERHLDPKEASSQAAAFFVNFRKRFNNAPIEEKKVLVRQVVLGVSVNPVEKVARCSITKIPMVSQALRSALLPSGFVGRTCSGDENSFQVTISREFEFPLFV